MKEIARSPREAIHAPTAAVPHTPMSYLLFPGRHLVNTRFQEEYLFRHVKLPIDHLVFAITSCNQSHSRYNPIAFHIRAIGVDRFARGVAQVLGVRYSIVGIPHHRPDDDFCELIVKEIGEQTDGEVDLSPSNTIVLTSTPALIGAWEALGYPVLTAEARREDGTFRIEQTTPVEIVRRIGEQGPAAMDSEWVRAKIHPASLSVLRDFPQVARTVHSLYTETILGDSGSLTETRDYDTYVRSMGGVIDLKYAEIRDFIVPGRIIDEGCADGALLTRIAQDHPDSDLIGVDISAEMLARAAERQRAGQFSGCFVFFRQWNLMKPLALRQPVDTVICNSTLHELWSYGRGQEDVEHYLRLKRDQLRTGGRLVIRDVVGPAGRGSDVLLWCNGSDGSEDDESVSTKSADRETLEAHLKGLSTRTLFRRFARDFLPQEGGNAFRWADALLPNGDSAYRLPLEYASEFITKMSYTDNWQSEMHERFCFWELDEWKAALEAAGFRVVEGSRAYVNEWRVENRFKGRVALYDVEGNALPFPATNMVLVGEKA